MGYYAGARGLVGDHVSRGLVGDQVSVETQGYQVEAQGTHSFHVSGTADQTAVGLLCDHVALHLYADTTKDLAVSPFLCY